jgi:release factor glutamine methyltransferase
MRADQSDTEDAVLPGRSTSEVAARAQRTLRETVARAQERLTASGVVADEAVLDAELLARHVLGWDRARFYLHRGDRVPSGFDDAYDVLVRRRAAREPISFITGQREFWGRVFAVNEAVLTPRPETEFVVEEALASIASLQSNAFVVDVGTGSGCLAVTLALERPRLRVAATDISPAALEVARRNASRHLVADRIDFRLADLLEGLSPGADVIVANLPYLPAAHAERLPPEVRNHEPSVALFGTEEDGLGLIRRLVQQAQAHLAPRGVLVLEFGIGQEQGIRELAAGLQHVALVRIRPDLQGIPRVAVMQRRLEP